MFCLRSIEVVSYMVCAMCGGWLLRIGTTVALLFPLFAVGPSSAQTGPPISRELAGDCFALTKELAEADGGRLWGISLAGPVMIVDPDTREIVANQADGEGQLIAAGDLWTGRLPANIQPANTSLEWAGVRWTMVLRNSIPYSRYERGRLFMHESFHSIQSRLGHDAASPPNAHLDEQVGRTWLRMEMRALAEAMIRQGTERETAARDALLFRLLRQALVGQAAAAEELALETNEGLAEYTGLRLSGMPIVTQEQRLAVGLERADASATMTRSFAYVTGPAWAMLLDGVSDEWKKTSGAEMNLASQYANSIAFEPLPDIKQVERLARDAAQQRYQGEEVFRDEAARSARRAARLAELQEVFAPQRVLRIETGPAFRFAFDPNTAESLGGKRTFYRSFQASDQWGTIDAPEGAVIDFESPMTISFPVPPGTSPETVPWKLELNQNYRLVAPESSAWSIQTK